MKTAKKPVLLWALLAIAVILGVVWETHTLPDASNRLEALSLKGNGYIGEDLPLEKWEKEVFGKVNLIKRIYKFNDQRCFVTVLDGTGDRHVVHDPTYCFTGSGWKVIERKPLEVSGGSIHIVTMQKGLFRKEAALWFSDGTHRYASPTRYFFATCLRRLTLGVSGEEPVLILIQPSQRNNINWSKLLKDNPLLDTL